MISAAFDRCDGGFMLRMRGHADKERSSGELVCAAASGIFYSLIGYLANECDGMKIRALSPGNTVVECREDGESAMKQACIGLIQLALTYPESIEVVSSAWGWSLTKSSNIRLD